MTTILDTSALITLYKINGVKYLNSLFNEVYIPLKVEREFLAENSSERFNFLLFSFEEHMWLKKCQTFNDETIDLLGSNRKLDPGEIETIAQYKQLQMDLKIEEGKINCILDESTARKVAQNMDIRVNGTLYLMALLDLNGFIDYHVETKRLKKERRFTEQIINEAYTKAKNNFKSGDRF